MKRSKERQDFFLQDSVGAKKMKSDPLQREDNPGKLENYISSEKMIELLKNKGVKSLFPVQYETYSTVYFGKDIMVRDKTGSGKTLAFALPIIQRLRKERAFEKNHLAKFLIVLPTRQLAMQVKDEIQSLRFKDQPDFRVIAVYGKSDMSIQIEKIGRGIDIIVGTPGRLIDLLERDVIKMNKMEVLCLDQADEMLKQGFKEDIEKIYKYITDNAPKKTQNLLFSATIPDWLHELSRKYQDRDTKFVNLIKEDALITPDKLVHMCIKIRKSDQAYRPKIVSNILKKFAIKSGNSIIFCERKSDVTTLCSSLKDFYQIESQALHSDIPQPRRERVYRDFKSGNLKCIIATNVAARGLDFPEIDVVIQTEPPRDGQSYIHRSGRTARKGKEGICVTIYNDTTERHIENIERMAKITMKKLDAGDYLKSSSSNQQGHESSSRNRDNDYDDEEVFEIYVKRLPYSASESDITNFFEDRKVRVKSVKLMKNSDGESKGCGFLKFTSRRDRDNCLQLDGERFDDNQISLTLPNKK